MQMYCYMISTVASLNYMLSFTIHFIFKITEDTFPLYNLFITSRQELNINLWKNLKHFRLI